MKGNKAIQYAHFNKGTTLYKNYFNRGARKLIRRQNRVKQAKKVFPAPLEKLRPIVRCQTRRYNYKEKYGRGFSLEELKAADIKIGNAIALNIAVDKRRNNKSEETFKQNVERLNEYKSKLVFFKNRQEARDSNIVQPRGIIMPMKKEEKGVYFVNKNEIENIQI